MDIVDLLDLSRDPVVVLTPPPVGAPRRVERYHSALEWLMARRTPFVLITRGSDDEGAEPQEDKKARAIWFKSNAKQLSELCRGFVYVEANDARRAALTAQAEAMSKAFPVPMIVVSDIGQSIDRALELLPRASVAPKG
jgi:hypothetical protein